jgi:hypothetical protein
MKNILEENAAPEEELPEGEDDGEDMDLSEGDPAYLKAKELLLSKLYEGGAAQGLAQAIGSAPDLKTGVVDQIMALLDVMEEATQGSVPDELVIPFVIETTAEVLQIAEAAGSPVPNDMAAEVVSEVLARVVENLGGDASAIRQEMASIDKAELSKAMGE